MVRYGLFLNVAETKGCWKSIYNFRLRCCPCSTLWGWSGCRKLRNAATKSLSSIRKYVVDKCKSAEATRNSNMFWDTIKSFMIEKVKSSNGSISNKISNSIVNEHAMVVNVLNENFWSSSVNYCNGKPIEEDECIESNIESHNEHLSIVIYIYICI